MKAGPECPECLKHLALQTIELATSDPKLKLEAQAMADQILSRFSLDLVPTELSNEFHRAIKRVTGNPDPYSEWKAREIETARQVYRSIQDTSLQDFRSCVELAALGNVLDFFVGEEHLKRVMKAKPRFSIDHVSLVERKLGTARRILYLADNAGEVFFDFPLVGELRKHAEVVYAVKAGPVQNDLTLEDLRRSGLSGEFGEVITIGTDSVGVDLREASREFQDEFEQADLVVAKGMGYYETLSELPPEGKVFYILRAKCGPVARSLGVDVDGYVAMLR